MNARSHVQAVIFAFTFILCRTTLADGKLDFGKSDKPKGKIYVNGELYIPGAEPARSKGDMFVNGERVTPSKGSPKGTAKINGVSLKAGEKKTIPRLPVEKPPVVENKNEPIRYASPLDGRRLEGISNGHVPASASVSPFGPPKPAGDKGNPFGDPLRYIPEGKTKAVPVSSLDEYVKDRNEKLFKILFQIKKASGTKLSQHDQIRLTRLNAAYDELTKEADDLKKRYDNARGSSLLDYGKGYVSWFGKIKNESDITKNDDPNLMYRNRGADRSIAQDVAKYSALLFAELHHVLANRNSDMEIASTFQIFEGQVAAQFLHGKITTALSDLDKAKLVAAHRVLEKYDDPNFVIKGLSSQILLHPDRSGEEAKQIRNFQSGIVGLQDSQNKTTLAQLRAAQTVQEWDKMSSLLYAAATGKP